MGRAAALLTAKSLPEGALEAHKALRKIAPPEVVRAALDLRELRGKAKSKFRHPEQVLLLAKGLEQATDGRVAAWRAAELARLVPACPVWDSTAGLGADAMACAEHGLTVLASDRDPLLAAIARHNLATLPPSTSGVWAVAADASRPPLADTGSWLLLLDPDRRKDAAATDRGRPGGGTRRLDPADFSPAITAWPSLLAAFKGCAVKLPPGLDPRRLEDASPLAALLAATPHRWVWTEAGGSLRELTLFTGNLAPPGEPPHSAVRLFGPDLPPAGAAPTSATFSAGPASPHAAPARSPAPEDITLIAEPRPSVRRAGLAQAASAAAMPSLTPIDEGESYFATTEPAPRARPTDFIDLFRVLASAPLDKKKVRRLCREHGIGPLTIKKRGLPESSAALEARLSPKAGRPGLAIASPTCAGRRLFLVEKLDRGRLPLETGP